MQPDFIFVSRKSDGELAASIVDPHGVYLGDALDKLVGLADYAEEHGDAFVRIDSLAEIDGEVRLLNMKDANVRAEPCARLSSAKSLYEGSVAQAHG